MGIAAVADVEAAVEGREFVMRLCFAILQVLWNEESVERYGHLIGFIAHSSEQERLKA